MSSKLVSTADSTLHFCNKSSKMPFPKNISRLSFISLVTKSRISIRNTSGPRRVRATARVEAFYAPAETKVTLYELLGIAETGSSFDDVKKAYKKMARLYHPDVSPPDRVDEHTKKFIMVKEAYEILTNPERKALYDRDLAGGLGFSFSARKSHQEVVEKAEWKTRWQSQLDELQQRSCGGECHGVLECATKHMILRSIIVVIAFFRLIFLCKRNNHLRL